MILDGGDSRSFRAGFLSRLTLQGWVTVFKFIYSLCLSFHIHKKKVLQGGRKITLKSKDIVDSQGR